MPTVQFRLERQVRQRFQPRRPAQQGIGGLEQCVGPSSEALIEAPPELAQPAELIVTGLLGQTCGHGHRLLFEIFGRTSKMIKRWPYPCQRSTRLGLKHQDVCKYYQPLIQPPLTAPNLL